MKRLSLLLCAVIFLLSALAESKTKSYTFDFSNPSSLNPSVQTPDPTESPSIYIQDMTFTSPDGIVTLRFQQETGAVLSARIVKDREGSSPALDLPRSCSVVVSASGVLVNRVAIPGNNDISGLTIGNGMTGTFKLSDNQSWYEWLPASNSGVNTVRLTNGSPAQSRIQKIVVDYASLRDVLRPTSTSIANNSTITSFSELMLTFSNAMKVVPEDPQFSLVDSKGRSYPLTATASGRNVILSVAAPITASEVYTLTVQAGSFEDSQQNCNVDLAYTFTIYRDYDITVPDVDYTLSPADGYSTDHLTSIKISFPSLSDVTLIDKHLIRLTSDGSASLTVPTSVYEVQGASNQFELVFPDMSVGTYTLTIDKGAFTYDYQSQRAPVQTITARYTVVKGDDFSYDFGNYNTIYRKESYSSNTNLKDVELNNMTLFSYDNDICVSDQLVTIVNLNSNEEVAHGHFEVVNDSELANAKSVIRLVMTPAIAEGSLRAATYAYKIPAGTYGDFNFGAYLADPAAFLASGKKKSDCHTNSYYYVIATVNNEQAGQEAGPDVPPETIRPSAEVLAAALRMLDMTGVGYPTGTSESRLQLQKLVDGNQGSDATFQSAMEAFAAETDIVKPVSGTYYMIAGISADGSQAWLHYDGKGVTLTGDATAASAFLATATANGAYEFSTAFDGRKLTVLNNGGSISDGGRLVLKRLSATGAMPMNTFGLLSIGDGLLLSCVNARTMEILAAAGDGVFSATATSGFRLTPVAADDITVPTPVSSITPEAGSILSSLSTFSLTISGASGIALADAKAIRLTGNGQTVTATSVTKSGDKTYTISFATELENGVYTLNVGEGAFTFLFAGRTLTVPSVSATYTLEQYPDYEVYENARQVLGNTGIGYPRATSAARTALLALVESGKGSTASFRRAIRNFMAETDIEKPATGSFYRIGATGNNNRTLYIGVDGKRLTLTDEDMAAVFKAIANADGSTTLAAVASKTLYMGLPADGDCLTEAYDPASDNLTVSRLLTGNEPSTDGSFGRVTISRNGSYAAANLSARRFMTSRAQILYEATETSAFRFVEISPEDISMPDMDATLTPASGTSLETLNKLVVSFTTDSRVSIGDPSLIKLVDLRLNEFTPKAVVPVEGADNTYEIQFINIAADRYRLTVGRGAFTADFLGREMPVEQFTADYTVQTTPSFVTDYDTRNGVKWIENPGEGGYVSDVALNVMTLVSQAPVAVARTQVIVRNYWNNQEVARGWLDVASPTTLYLVLEKPVQAGSIPAGTYEYVIPEATYGDENYGRYLADPMSVSKSDCHVNARIPFLVKVDNVRASITDVQAGDREDSPVYDLQGRRAATVQPGRLYIRGGRKYMQKK